MYSTLILESNLRTPQLDQQPEIAKKYWIKAITLDLLRGMLQFIFSLFLYLDNNKNKNYSTNPPPLLSRTHWNNVD